jgi:hypothetical protein
MGIFTYEIVLLDIPFKKMLRAGNKDLKFQRGHIHSAGSMTPQKSIKN